MSKDLNILVTFQRIFSVSPSYIPSALTSPTNISYPTLIFPLLFKLRHTSGSFI